MSDIPENTGRPSNGVSQDQSRNWEDLTAEIERLRAELAETRIDRDDYLKALYRLAPECAFTEAEVQEMLTNRGSGREFITRILESLEAVS